MRRTRSQANTPPAPTVQEYTLHQLLALDVMRGFVDWCLEHLGPQHASWARQAPDPESIVLKWHSAKLIISPGEGGKTIKGLASLHKSTITRVEVNIAFTPGHSGLSTFTGEITWGDNNQTVRDLRLVAKLLPNGRVKIIDPNREEAAA